MDTEVEVDGGVSEVLVEDSKREVVDEDALLVNEVPVEESAPERILANKTLKTMIIDLIFVLLFSSTSQRYIHI